MSDEHPSERWMWGREEAVGTVQSWYIHHNVLRNGKWVPDKPYACHDQAFALETAVKMNAQRSSVDDRLLYRDVTITGPHVSWREVWWKYRDEEREVRAARGR